MSSTPPTSSPAPSSYSVTTMVVLSGYTLATFNPSVQALFTNTIASSLDVSPSQVTLSSVSYSAARRQALTAGVSVTVTVSFPSASAAEAAVGPLSNTVSSVSLLQAAGLTSLTSVTVTTPATVIVVPSPASVSSPSSGGSTIIIAAAAGGGGGLVVLIIIRTVFVMRRRGRSAQKMAVNFLVTGTPLVMATSSPPVGMMPSEPRPLGPEGVATAPKSPDLAPSSATSPAAADAAEPDVAAWLEQNGVSAAAKAVAAAGATTISDLMLLSNEDIQSLELPVILRNRLAAAIKTLQ